jgi:hypothetical protein
VYVLRFSANGTLPTAQLRDFDSNKSLPKELTHFRGMTSPYDEAFSYCTSLTNVTIPNGVTSIAMLDGEWPQRQVNFEQWLGFVHQAEPSLTGLICVRLVRCQTVNPHNGR